MSLSTSILNSDDNEWIQGRLLAEIQRLNARIDELEQDTLRKSENLNDLPEPELAVSNINYSYDGGSVINNVIQNTGGSSPGGGFSGSYNDLTDVPETIGKDSSVWFINDAPLGMYDGNDIFFASGTAASPTTANAGSAVGWLYSASRTVSWQFDGSDLILGDAPVGSTPDGTDPIVYSPSAVDGLRELNLDVALLLKGIAGTSGQVIKADADGKGEWADESAGGGGASFDSIGSSYARTSVTGDSGPEVLDLIIPSPSIGDRKKIRATLIGRIQPSPLVDVGYLGERAYLRVEVDGDLLVGTSFTAPNRVTVSTTATTSGMAISYNGSTDDFESNDIWGSSTDSVSNISTSDVTVNNITLYGADMISGSSSVKVRFRWSYNSITDEGTLRIVADDANSNLFITWNAISMRVFG